ncbi:putative porin [Sulfuriferula sp.]|uniref:putative porin n=1 Tax=Sulfuriferula sp. TaxID=2025307 RepID=UPI0027315673|nr:putative porin [Sulfuriferula sp.]MDP2027815.1 putative porin [Sulfuriferula sp.]
MKMKMTKIAAVLALTFACQGAQAGEKQEMEALRQTTLNLIEALVQQGLLTRDKADQLVKSATVTQPAAQPEQTAQTTDANVVRVQYVPESVKREIREQIKGEVLAQAKSERWGDPGAMPDWVGRFKLSGDVRLRLQQDLFQKDNATPAQLAQFGINMDNSTENRERALLRVRLGMGIKVADDWTAGLRLTTGSTTGPVSTNQALGNSFNKYTVVFDQAYLKYDPYRWLTVSGGRIPNPWFSTDLVWDDDLNFEGVAATYKPQLSDSVTGFLTGGAFAVQDIQSSDTVKAKSKWLFGAQAGAEWVAEDMSKFKLGISYYRYTNIAGQPNPFGSTPYSLTAANSPQKGNSMFNNNALNNFAGNPNALAANFHELNITAAYDWAAFDPMHVILSGDFVKNIGFDRAEILQRTGRDIQPKTTGYQAKVTLGVPIMMKNGDWQAYFGYRHLERDAVLDAFTDSDFHLGGTDAKGYFIGGNYGLNKNAWVGLRYLSADQIDGPPLAIDVLQVDLNAKF